MQPICARGVLVLSLLVVSSVECNAQYSIRQGYGVPAQSYPQSSYPAQQYYGPVQHSDYVQHGYSAAGWQSQPRTYSQPYSVQQGYGDRRYSTAYRPAVRAIDSLQQGQYYDWEHAAGTSSRGYLANDGSRWRLLHAAGIVEIDGSGHRRMVSSATTGHPYQHVWQIDRPGNTKTAWISRDDATGIASVLYKRPAYQSPGKFYQATVTLENNTRITGLQWVQTPTWASSVNLVSASRGARLPAGIFRSTSEQYVPASSRDLELLRNSDSRNNVTETPQMLRPYESTGRSFSPISGSSILDLTIPE